MVRVRTPELPPPPPPPHPPPPPPPPTPPHPPPPHPPTNTTNTTTTNNRMKPAPPRSHTPHPHPTPTIGNLGIIFTSVSTQNFLPMEMGDFAGSKVTQQPMGAETSCLEIVFTSVLYASVTALKKSLRFPPNLDDEWQLCSPTPFST